MLQQFVFVLLCLALLALVYLYPVLFALCGFAYACNWSHTQLKADKFNEPPPPVAPRRRQREREMVKVIEQTPSSASLNKREEDEVVFEDENARIARVEAVEFVQRRLLAARSASSSPVPVPIAVVAPTLVAVAAPEPIPPRPEHPNDQIRREMGLSRPPPPHLDVRNRERDRDRGSMSQGLSPAAMERAKLNARRPTRRSGDRATERHHCGSCNKSFNDLYSFEQHNLLRHPEAPRKPTGEDNGGEVSYDLPGPWRDRADPAVGRPGRLALRDVSSAFRQCAFALTGMYAPRIILTLSITPLAILFYGPQAAISAESPVSGLEKTPKFGRTAANTAPRDSLHRTREKHPFAHGDQSALAAAFPPLSASPSSTSSTSNKPSTVKDTPVSASPIIAYARGDSGLLDSVSLDSASGEADKPFSSLLWALGADEISSPTPLEIIDPVREAAPGPLVISDADWAEPAREPLVITDDDWVAPAPEPVVISDEDWVTPWANDPPIAPPSDPVVHQWQEMDPADYPLPPSPEFDPDPAVALDQPLPSFSISTEDVGDTIPFNHPAPVDLIRHVKVGHGNPDGEESTEVPSPFHFGEIIPDPVPPGIDAFPELPSRQEAATPRAKPEVPYSRWHTDEQPDFALPDLSLKVDVERRSSHSSSRSNAENEMQRIISRSTVGDGGSASPEKRLSRWESSDSPKLGLSRWASADSGDAPRAESVSRWAAEEDSPRESSSGLPVEETEPVPRDFGRERRWAEQVDDEYADEIPGVFIGSRPPVSGTNNIPLGPSRMPNAGGPSMVHQSRYAAPPSVPRPSSQGGSASGRSSGSYQSRTQSEHGYGQPSYPADGPHYANGGYSGGYTSNGSYSQPPPPPVQSYRAESSHSSKMEHVQEQLPNFAYDTDTNFNAFSHTSSSTESDPLAPIPAPPLAQPSAWDTSSNPNLSGLPPARPSSPKLSYNATPRSPDAYRSGASDVSETSSGGRRFGSHFGGAIGSVIAPIAHPGPGTRGRWADRPGAPQQYQQQQQQQQSALHPSHQPARMAPGHMYQVPPKQPPRPPSPRFDASSGWLTTAPAAAPKRGLGGRPIHETYSEKEMRKRQAEADKIVHIAKSEQDGFGGW